MRKNGRTTQIRSKRFVFRHFRWKAKVKKLEKDLDGHKFGSTQMLERNEQLIRDLDATKTQNSTFKDQIGKLENELADAHVGKTFENLRKDEKNRFDFSSDDTSSIRRTFQTNRKRRKKTKQTIELMKTNDLFRLDESNPSNSFDTRKRNYRIEKRRERRKEKLEFFFLSFLFSLTDRVQGLRDDIITSCTSRLSRETKSRMS